MSLGDSAEPAELRLRARALAAEIEPFELQCEQDRGLLGEVLTGLADQVRRHRLNAINMPTEWGGQGLGVAEQVTVQVELGRLTNALWDVVWRPANVLRHCTPAQRERFLLPAIAGRRRDCFAVTEPGAGSDPSRVEATAEPVAGGYRLNGEKWFVTAGDVADFLIVLARTLPGEAPTLFLVDKALPGVRLRGGRRRPAAQAAAREGRHGQALRVGARRARGRPLPAGAGRTRLHAREPCGASVSRHPRGPHLGGHLGNPAPDHRQRDRQAGGRGSPRAARQRRSTASRRRRRRPAGPVTATR